MEDKNIRRLNIFDDNITNKVFLFYDKIEEESKITVFNYEKLLEREAIGIENNLVEKKTNVLDK